MADMIISITVPSDWVADTLAAFTTIAGGNMTIQSSNAYANQWSFALPAQGGSSDDAFCKKIFCELGEAIVNMIDIGADTVRYNTEVAELIPPASDVPDNIFT